MLGVVLNLVSLGEAVPSAGYTAHEWGTFTSVQGADGVPLAWNPFTRSDLPSFVYRRQRPMPAAVIARNPQGFAFLNGKDNQSWLQRMETPVIYFHTDHPVSIQARVRFPQGLITEWFPQAAGFGPVFGVENVLPDTRDSFLQWPVFWVSPTTDHPEAVLPHEPGPSHYYAARNVRAGNVTVTDPNGGPGETDRFLFYRGAGNFATPLRVSMPSPRHIVLKNTGRQVLRGLHIVEARKDQAFQTRVAELAPGESLPIHLLGAAALTARTEATGELIRRLQLDLTAAGLHADEATAMVATWRDAWLEEDGLRVLYLMPREWTDATLPLDLNPAPRELVRVMVGRAEVFTPDEERVARAAFARFQGGHNARFLLDGFAGVNPRFQEPLLTRVGALEANWLRTSSLFSCSIPAFSPQADDALKNDLRAAREALLAKTSPPADVVPNPSDRSRRQVQLSQTLIRTPK